jgi:O-antigen/teichoic acid export membrane protein
VSDPGRDQNIRQRVMRGTLANYGARLVGIATWFFITPEVLRVLGEAGFGLWVLAAALIGYGSLLDLGIGGAITKFVAEYRARSEDARIKELLGSALLIYSCVGIAVALVTLVLVPISDPLFGGVQGDANVMRTYILLVGLTIAVTIPSTIVQAVLNGLQRYDIVSLSATIGNFFSAGGTLLVVYLGGGLIGAVAINLPTTVLMQVLNTWFLRRIAPEVRMDWRASSRPMNRMIISYSWSLLVGRVAKRLKSKSDELEIAAFLPVSAVAPYAIARRLAELGQNLADQFLRVLLPVASELHAGDDRARLRNLYSVGTRVSLLIYVPIACTLTLLAGPILALWIRPEYGAYAYLVALLTLAALVDTSQWPASTIMQGMAYHRPVMIAAFVSSIANLGLSIALVRPLGLLGVALGTLVPTLVENLFFVLPYSIRVLGMRPLDCFREVFFPALAPALPMALVLYVVQRTLDVQSVFGLVLAAAIGGLVYALGYLAAGAGTPELRLCLNFAQSRLRLTGARLPRS